MAIEPVTREERFLAAAGGQSVTPPTPITRKEQLLQGIIDAVKSSGATPDVIENAVNKYLDANPVQPGATTEQAAQIEQNKTDIADLQTEVDELKESGGNGSGQNPGQDGEDGFSPIATVTQTADGATISITDANGTTTATVTNGKDGKDGVDGQDGYTPQKGVDYFDGQPGKDGADGKDGYTPVKGKDYFDGKNGQDGSPGKDGADGVSVTHEWNGTVLKVTSASGTSSADLKGERGEPGKDGSDGAPGSAGADGQPGKDGTSPVVSVSTITGGHRITITDVNGTKTVDVMDGSDGKDGTDGSPGADGSPGQDGQNGSDGVGIASIKQTTTSTADGGNNVFTVTLTNGTSTTFAVKNGSKGSTGATGAAGKNGSDGYSPVRGTDYWTEADKVEIVQRVIESLGGNPIFGIVDENNNIIVSGDLPDGTYSVKYEMENGTKLNIGNLVIDTNVYYTVTNTLTNCTNSNSATQVIEGENYSATITAKSGYELKSVTVTMGGSPVTVSGGKITIANVTGNIVITAVAEVVASEPINQIPLSTDASGNLYNGGQGWKTGYRLSSSSGSESSQSGVEVTGFIPCKYTDTIYFKNITITAAGTETYCFYDSSRTRIAGGTTGGTFGTTSGGVISKAISSISNTQLQDAKDKVAFIRISANSITTDSIITISEPIS